MNIKLRSNQRTRILFVLLLVTQVGLLIGGAVTHSPTLNEPAHLAAGLHHWQHADFSAYSVNPPLVRLLAAIPAKIFGHKADWSASSIGVGERPEFELGADFISANGRYSFTLLQMGRVAVLPFTVLGTLVCFLWATKLSGHEEGGLVAAGLWAFDPFTLGHGSLLTPDCHGASMGIAAGYTFWRWLREPTWREATISGVTLGLAESCKTTLVVFLPLWPVIWIVDRLCRRRHCSNLSGNAQGGITKTYARSLWAEAAMLIFRTFLALYVLNSIYLWQGSGQQLQDYRFVSRMFGGEDRGQVLGVCRNRFSESWLGSVPLPLPQAYVTGIDLQQRDFEGYQSRSYLRGQWSEFGWWWYYIYVLLVKEPLGTLALVIFSAIVLLTYRKNLGNNATSHKVSHAATQLRNAKKDLFVVLAPAIIIFAIVSSKTRINEHGRYLLPALPFFFVAIGMVQGLAFRIRSKNSYPDRFPGRSAEVTLNVEKLSWIKRIQAPKYVTISLMVLMIFESLWVWPGSLAFFNFASGGTEFGPNHLLGSNVDWGQDLRRLNLWTHKNPEKRPVFLAYNEAMYDFWQLADDGLISWPLVTAPAASENGKGTRQLDAYEHDGYFAIAVGLLYGEQTAVQRRDGSYIMLDMTMLQNLRHVNPIARVGETIRVFSADQLRSALATSINNNVN